MADTRAPRGTHTPHSVREARTAFLAWLNEAGAAGRRFLQLEIRRAGETYEIRHADDAGSAGEALERATDPYAARPLAQTTSEGQHRPLKTAPNLRGGWRLQELDAAGLFTALDYFYPAAVAHWHAGRSGSLIVTHWRETAARQSGIYGAVGLLADRTVRDVVAACCDDSVCLRRVAWGIDEETPLHVASATPDGAAELPCPEACSLFVSLARKVLAIERQPRTAVPGLGSLAPEEIEQLREIVAAAADGTLPDVREGDFEAGANRRRIRYLAARLRSEAPAGPDAP